MDVLVTPQPLSGTVTAPASKSDVHRALICAALSHEPTVIRSVKAELISVSHDIHATGHCLKVLGTGIDVCRDHARVTPLSREGLPRPHLAFECESSGSTARFMLPLAGVLCEGATFTGSAQLTARPLGDLLVAMYEHGVRFAPAGIDQNAANTTGIGTGPLATGGGRATLRSLTLPLTMTGRLGAGDYEIPGDISSQYVTGLLFAMSLLSDMGAGKSTLTLTSPLESAGYVDMTIEWLAHFGITVEPDLGGWVVPADQRFTSPGDVVVEGDWSNGAILLALAAFNPGVKVKGLKASSLQPDRVIERLLPTWRQVRQSRTQDVRETPDLFPLLALLAAAPASIACGQAAPVTTFTGIDRLRYKESNRVKTTLAILEAAGVKTSASKETCAVTALSRKPSRKVIEVDAAGDHRIVMAAVVAAHVFDRPVLIRGAEAIAKSYPIFFDDYRHLGGRADVQSDN